MAFDFPASPTVGQRYTLNGIIFEWNGYAWNAGGEGEIGARITVSETPPLVPAPTQLWWESDSGILFLWYDDGDTQQWVQISGGMPGKDGKDGLNAVKTALSRNLLVNPAGLNSQENGRTASTVTSYYVADQWRYDVNGSMPVQAQSFDGDPPYMRITSTATAAVPGASNYAYLMQPLEGVRVSDLKWGTPDAIPAVLRFKARAVHPTFSQSFGITVRNGGTPTRTFTSRVVVTPAWQVFEIPIPPCTDGVWANDNTAALSVGFSAVVGSSFVAPTPDVWVTGNYLGNQQHNVTSTAGTGFDVTEIGLHADPDNTGKAPPWQTPDYGDMLRDCQRYYEKGGIYGINAYGVAMAATWRVPFLVQKRALATISASPTSVGNCSLQNHDIITTFDFRVYLAVSATGAFYYAANWVANARM